jgi:hypothetical protein
MSRTVPDDYAMYYSFAKPFASGNGFCYPSTDYSKYYCDKANGMSGGKKKKVTKRKPTKKVTKRKPTKKVTKRKPTKKVTKRKPTKKVTKRKPTKKVTKRKPTKKVTKRKPTKKVTKRKPTKKVTKHKKVKHRGGANSEIYHVGPTARKYLGYAHTARNMTAIPVTPSTLARSIHVVVCYQRIHLSLLCRD